MYTLKLETVEGSKMFFECNSYINVQPCDKLDQFAPDRHTSIIFERIYVAPGYKPEGILCETTAPDGKSSFIGTNYFAFLLNETGETIEVLNRPVPENAA